MASDGTAGLAPALAIPLGGSNRRLVDRLARGEEIERGDIGLRTGPSHLDARPLPGTGDAPGLIVVAVEPGGPAEQAGLRLGDVILRVDGRALGSADELEERVSEAQPGSRLSVVARRDGSELSPLSIVVRRESPSARSRAVVGDGREWRGARLSPLPESLRRQMAVPAGSLMVVRVASDSAASRAGLEPGSVIVRVGGRTLDSPESVGPSIDDAKADVVLGLASGATKLVRAD
jgi:serine protease Do